MGRAHNEPPPYVGLLCVLARFGPINAEISPILRPRTESPAESSAESPSTVQSPLAPKKLDYAVKHATLQLARDPLLSVDCVHHPWTIWERVSLAHLYRNFYSPVTDRLHERLSSLLRLFHPFGYVRPSADVETLLTEIAQKIDISGSSADRLARSVIDLVLPPGTVPRLISRGSGSLVLSLPLIRMRDGTLVEYSDVPEGVRRQIRSLVSAGSARERFSCQCDDRGATWIRERTEN